LAEPQEGVNMRRAEGGKAKCNLPSGRLCLSGEILSIPWSPAGTCSRQTRSASAITTVLAVGCRKLSAFIHV